MDHPTATLSLPEPRCPGEADVVVDLGPQLDHELRTPLTLIMGYTELLLSGDAGGLTTEQTSYLESVAAGGRRLCAAIQQLRDDAQAYATVQYRGRECGLALMGCDPRSTP